MAGMFFKGRSSVCLFISSCPALGSSEAGYTIKRKKEGKGKMGMTRKPREINVLPFEVP